MKAKCSGCGRRIPRSEPDLILRRMDPDNPMRTALRLVYHERCWPSAAGRVSESPPALWRMTHRHIEAEAN
jgi:hypothetical protein